MPSSLFAVMHRRESSHTWNLRGDGVEWGRLIIHQGAEWLRAYAGCRLLSSCTQQDEK